VVGSASAARAGLAAREARVGLDVVACRGDRFSGRIVAACGLSRSPWITRGLVGGGWETPPHSSGSEREPFPFFRAGSMSFGAFSGSADPGRSASVSPEVRVVGGVSAGRSSPPPAGSNLPPPLVGSHTYERNSRFGLSLDCPSAVLRISWWATAPGETYRFSVLDRPAAKRP
jgi:hypothetical protein